VGLYTEFYPSELKDREGEWKLELNRIASPITNPDGAGGWTVGIKWMDLPRFCTVPQFALEGAYHERTTGRYINSERYWDAHEQVRRWEQHWTQFHWYSQSQIPANFFVDLRWVHNSHEHSERNIPIPVDQWSSPGELAKDIVDAVNKATEEDENDSGCFAPRLTYRVNENGSVQFKEQEPEEEEDENEHPAECYNLRLTFQNDETQAHSTGWFPRSHLLWALFPPDIAHNLPIPNSRTLYHVDIPLHDSENWSPEYSPWYNCCEGVRSYLEGDGHELTHLWRLHRGGLFIQSNIVQESHFVNEKDLWIQPARPGPLDFPDEGYRGGSAEVQGGGNTESGVVNESDTKGKQILGHITPAQLYDKENRFGNITHIEWDEPPWYPVCTETLQEVVIKITDPIGFVPNWLRPDTDKIRIQLYFCKEK
jgi:hypothetical protein